MTSTGGCWRLRHPGPTRSPGVGRHRRSDCRDHRPPGPPRPIRSPSWPSCSSAPGRSSGRGRGSRWRSPAIIPKSSWSLSATRPRPAKDRRGITWSASCDEAAELRQAGAHGAVDRGGPDLGRPEPRRRPMRCPRRPPARVEPSSSRCSKPPGAPSTPCRRCCAPPGTAGTRPCSPAPPRAGHRRPHRRHRTRHQSRAVAHTSAVEAANGFLNRFCFVACRHRLAIDPPEQTSMN